MCSTGDFSLISQLCSSNSESGEYFEASRRARLRTTATMATTINAPPTTDATTVAVNAMRDIPIQPVSASCRVVRAYVDGNGHGQFWMSNIESLVKKQCEMMAVTEPVVLNTWKSNMHPKNVMRPLLQGPRSDEQIESVCLENRHRHCDHIQHCDEAIDEYVRRAHIICQKQARDIIIRHPRAQYR
jgi:hypothetical protein